MEVPPLVLLYAVLAAGGVAALIYMFNLYDSAVYQVNDAACQELRYLLETALQRAVAEPGNYTAYINTTYVVVIEAGQSARDAVLVVGRDTRRPAACNIGEAVERVCGRCKAEGMCGDCAVSSGTGLSIVVEKRVGADQYDKCAGAVEMPYYRYIKKEGKLYPSKKCEEGALVEKPAIEIYAG